MPFLVGVEQHDLGEALATPQSSNVTWEGALCHTVAA